MVNVMRAKSTIPSCSFQEDLLISAKKSLQRNWQAGLCQSPVLMDGCAHQDIGLSELQPFVLKSRESALSVDNKRPHVDPERPSLNLS